MKLKKALFKEILFQYKQFFSYDVEFSLICGRNFVYLDTLRGLLYLMISDDLKEDKVNTEKFVNLQNNIKKLYKSIINSKCIKQYKCHKINIYEKNVFSNTTDKIYSAIIKNLKIYLVIYEILYRKKPLKHEGMLIELNNAFAHMLTYGLSGQTNDLKNLEKANDHLLRGALDGLKALVLLNMDEIKRNDKLLKNLITLRVEEAKSIGQIQNNKIIDKYIKFLQMISQ